MDFKKKITSRLVKLVLLSFLAFIGFCGFGQSVKPSKPAFSNFVRSNGLLFVSGQTGTGMTGESQLSFSDEAESAMRKIEEILKINKLSTSNVVSCNVYLTDINQFDEFNSIYRKYFNVPFPSRTCVVVHQLVQKAKIEISVIASFE